MAAPGSPLPTVDALFEQAPCGLMLTSEDGTIRRVNTTFCTWTGRSPDTLVDRLRLSDLLTIGGRLFHQTHWTPLLRMQGSVAEVKLDILHADGQRLPMLMNAQRREHGNAAYHEIAALVVADRHRYEQELLLERQKAEAALERLNESQLALREAEGEAAGRALFAEQMMGIVSHDLRNPLSAVLMSAHALSMSDLSTNQMRAVSRIVSASNRAQRLIADLLDFTQARLGQGLSVVPADVSLHDLVAGAADELMSAFPGRRLVHVRLGEGRCRGDADRLAQLLGNLVANAFSYGAPDHPVTVTTEMQPSHCRIAVHNAGPPIPAQIQATLFEPMQRGDEAGSVRSVGLGLFIVREIARAHGGSVQVRSTATEGTTFSVALPKAAER